jgi:uroporphyrinogen-III decarboxylase
MMASTSRERLMKAFYLEEPDTVPVTFAYVNPFADLGPDAERLGYDRFHGLVREKTDILLPRGPNAPGMYYSSTDQVSVESETRQEGDDCYRCDVLTTPGGKLEAKRKSEKDIHTTWTYKGYVESDEDVEKILSMPFDPIEVDMSPVREAQEELGNRGVATTGISDPICACADLFTLRNFALTASQKPRTMKKLLRFFAERIEDFAKQMSEQSTDVFYRIVGPEYATPPILPPELFEEYVVPYDKKLVNIIRDSGNIAAIHSHGQLRRVLDGFRRIDPQVLEPIEPPPKGDIPLSEIKERLGDRTCLMGHIQYNDLEFETAENISRSVRSAIDQGAAGSGFVLFPTAEPIARISDRLLRNMKEFVSSGREYGRY